MVDERMNLRFLIPAIMCSILVSGSVGAENEPNDTWDTAEPVHTGVISGFVNETDVDFYRIEALGYYDLDIIFFNQMNNDSMEVVIFSYTPQDRFEFLNTSIQPGKEYEDHFYVLDGNDIMVIMISGNGSYMVQMDVYEDWKRVEEPYYYDSYEEEETILSPVVFGGVCIIFIVLIIIVAAVAAFAIALWMLNKD